MRINNNLMAMNTHRQLTINQGGAQKSIEKLSSGFRINRAGDDAAGLAISEKMRAQIRGLNQASRNSQDAISLIQTAEGALNESQAILQRMRELAVQSSNDTNVSLDRDAIQSEMNELTSEINRIGNTTEFNTQKLLNGERSTTAASTAVYTESTGNGLSITQTDGTLSAGSYTLEVNKNSDVLASTDDGKFATDGFSNTSGATIASAAINIVTGGASFVLASAAGTTFATSVITVEVGSAANTIDVSVVGADLQNPITGRTINAAADGSYTFSEGGIEFTLTDTGTASADGDVIFTHTITGGTTNYTAVDTQQDLWTSNGAMTASGSTLSATQSAGAEAGTWTGTFVGTAQLKLEFVGDDGTTYSATITDQDTTFEYNQNGVNFKIVKTAATDLTAGAAFSFTVSESYTYAAELKDSAGATEFTVDLAVGDTSGTGAITITAASSAMDNLTITSTGAVSTGTVAVTIDEEITTSDGSLQFQIGSNENQGMSLAIGDMRSDALGISDTAASSTASGTTVYYSDLEVTDGTSSTATERALDVSTAARAASAITVLDTALNSVSTQRSTLGATQNRLEHTIKNLDTSSENLQASESRIRDVDMAKEMMEFTKQNILQQAAQAMLAQANQAPQGVLQLLR